jgi:eukaryotic-like serine/threonine-protein kinase
VRQALRHLRLHAEGLPDGPVRERFLSRVPENARVLHLARQRSLA